MDLKSIEAFLVSALTEDELRRLCAHLPGGAALALALPGHGAPFDELAHQAVVMLHQQRRLDAAFFDLLRERVPNRAAEIRALADGASPQAPSASPPTGVARTAPVQIRQDEITGGVGVQVKEGFRKAVDVAQRFVRGGKGLLGDADPKTPERTVHIQQDRIEGGVGVSVGQANTVIFNNDKLWAFGMVGLGLFVVVGLVSFATNIAGVQDGLCRAPGVRGACFSLGLGHVPSPEEEASWALVRQGEDCEALRGYLTRWPAGAFAAEALARLNGRSVSTETRWVKQEMRLPMTVRGGALFEEEEAAREEALLRAAASAEQTCEPLRLSAMHRLLGSSSTVNAWSCALIERRWRCGFDGAAVCRVEIGRSLTVERCSPSEETP